MLHCAYVHLLLSHPSVRSHKASHIGPTRDKRIEFEYSVHPACPNISPKIIL